MRPDKELIYRMLKLVSDYRPECSSKGVGLEVLQSQENTLKEIICYASICDQSDYFLLSEILHRNQNGYRLRREPKGYKIMGLTPTGYDALEKLHGEFGEDVR